MSTTATTRTAADVNLRDCEAMARLHGDEIKLLSQMALERLGDPAALEQVRVLLQSVAREVDELKAAIRFYADLPVGGAR